MIRLNRWQCSLQTYLLIVSLVACAMAGTLVRRQWRSQLFAEMSAIGNERNAPIRVMTTNEFKWFGLFNWNASESKRSTGNAWWIDPVTHNCVTEMTLSVSGAHHPSCESILNHRESLRGLISLELFGADAETPLNFPIQAARLPDIRNLSLNNVLIAKQDFLAIADMPDLEIVQLRKCRFEKEDIKVLRTNKHLAWLILYQEIQMAELESLRTALPQVFVSAFPAVHPIVADAASVPP